MKKVSTTRWVWRISILTYITFGTIVDSLIAAHLYKFESLLRFPLPIRWFIVPSLILGVPFMFVAAVLIVGALAWGMSEIIYRFCNFLWCGHWESYEESKRREIREQEEEYEKDR